MNYEFDKENIIWLLESALTCAKGLPSNQVFPKSWKWATFVPNCQVFSVIIDHQDLRPKKKDDDKEI